MPHTLLRCLTAGLLVLCVPILAACGSTKKKSSAGAKTAAGTLPISISESGTKATFTVPSSAPGGVVTLALTNNGKAGHGAQLVRFDPPHTATEAIQALGRLISGQTKTTPSWLHAQGGIGGAMPGGTVKAVLNLPAGSYLVFDASANGPGPQTGPPAFSPFTVTAGKAGSLPATTTTVTAANPSKDHYKWQISGTLNAGVNTITFDSKGAQALHQLSAVRLTSTPSKAQIIKALNSNGPPPSFIDPSSFYSTAVLDGNTAQVTPLPLQRPGTYLLFCHLRDRNGGKFHYEEGLLTTVTVK